MPVGLSTASVARFAAGALAALWAMAALANEYVTLEAVGPSAPLLIAIVADVFLIAGASLAFVSAGGWRPILLAALVLVTIDRIANAVGAGLSAALPQILSTIVAFGAIALVALVGIRRTGRT